jgi:RNA polymerase sigma factor (TIGR02999 family)
VAKEIARIEYITTPLESHDFPKNKTEQNRNAGMPSNSHQITDLLIAWSDGNKHAQDQLMPLIHDELRRIARRYLQREGEAHTLETGALVNEAYLRLIDQTTPWRNRAHFLGIAARMMRRILVDHARAHLYAKRGGAVEHISLTEAEGVAGGANDLLKIDEALLALSQVDPRQGQIVELKFFAGMTIDEIAEVTGISTATIEREWRFARAWLSDQLTTHA